jgi:membrane fusion protein, heavy metal efflux system
VNHQKFRSGAYAFNRAAAIALTLLFTHPLLVVAHGGHGHEFKEGGAASGNSSISVDAETVKRLGLKVEAARARQLGIGLKTTGQIDMLPNQKAEVTAPVKGKVVTLLVQPGSVVRQGQPVATMTSGELSDLRVSSQEKQAEAAANLRQAQVDLQLAQENYQRYRQIAEAEIAQARSQLAAAQAQYQRDRSLVSGGSIVKVAKTNYQRQVQISQTEIEQARIEIAVAQERYNQDQQLVASGALARRQMLESQAQLAAANSKLVKANSRPEVLQAETEVRKAEVDLPIRQLQESAGKLAEAQAAVTRALTKKEVIAAEAQFKRAQASVAAAKTKLGLSNKSYQIRLQQLGTIADSRGLVTIVAPISGTIADREVTIGQSVQDSGAKLMSIVNDLQVLATANIYEQDLGQIRLGEKVNVRVASLPNRLFTGTINRIGTVVGEGRVVPVQAQLDNAARLLKPGMFAELEVVTDRLSKSVIAIPTTAIIEANGKKLVYVQSGDTFQAVEVSLGQTIGDLAEVKTGLFAGDRVVVQRGTLLYAQSLRSITTSTKQPAPPPLATTPGTMLLWVWLVAGGGSIIGGLYWWRRNRNISQIEPLNDQFDEDQINSIITGILIPEPPALPSDPEIDPTIDPTKLPVKIRSGKSTPSHHAE